MNRFHLTPFALAVGVAISAAATGLQAASSQKEDSDYRPLTSEAVSTAKMAFRSDADMRAILDKMMTFKPKAIEKLTPEQARQEKTITDAVKAELTDKDRSTDPATLVPGVTSTDRDLTLSTGIVKARIYTPNGTGPFPAVLYSHGGGFVLADREVYDAGARGIAKQAQAVVVSIDYRKAPEHKFPAAHDDALASYRWLVENAAQIKADPKRLALAGESAGGNLAIATATAARDAKLPAPYAILSIYPVAETAMNTESYKKYKDAKPLNAPMMKWFFDQYTRTPADLQDPRLNLVAANLSGLAPVTIINAEIDPLLDDGAQLEAALKKAGVPVKRAVYEGVTHEFFGTAALVADAKKAQLEAGKALKASSTATTVSRMDAAKPQ
jgi:acetyl esterase